MRRSFGRSDRVGPFYHATSGKHPLLPPKRHLTSMITKSRHVALLTNVYRTYPYPALTRSSLIQNMTAFLVRQVLNKALLFF